MLRGNLSTRPFYNERLVSLVLLLVAVVTVVLAVFNITQIMALTSQRAEFKARQQRDENEAARIRTEAANLQKTVDPVRLRVLEAATREANSLIDQRTFSWTAFFGYVEKTLPLDVRLVAVSPRVERGEFKITMIVTARRLDDLEAFGNALQDTGAFYDVAPTERQRNDDGTLTATVVGSYLPPASAGRAVGKDAAKPAPGKGRP